MLASQQRRGPFERISWFYYHSVPILNGNSLVSFNYFQDTTTATRQESNMRLPGTIPNPEVFKIYEIRFHVSLGSSLGANPVLRAPDDVQQLTNGALQLFVSNKPMIQIPLWKLPSGGGAFGQFALASNAASTIALGINGFPTVQAAYRLRRPIVITSVENVLATTVYDTAPNPAADARCFVLLHGVLRRAIN